MSAPVERLLNEVLRVVTALGGAAQATHGLAARERKLVEQLARSEGFVDVSAIARSLLQPVVELERGVAALEGTGWIETRRDRLQRQVALTREGRERWQSACDAEHALYRLLSSGLDEHTLRSTLATLRTVRRRLERSDYAQMPMLTADSESFARAGLTRARCA